jgi:hypothetical protein
MNTPLAKQLAKQLVENHGHSAVNPVAQLVKEQIKK